MADGLSLKLDSREFDRYAEQMLQKLGTLEPLFKTIIPILHNSLTSNFRVGGRPRKWKALSAMTLAMRARKHTIRAGVGLDQPILQETGKLRASIGSVRDITKTFLRYGTNDIRSTTLQKGRGAMSGTALVPAHTRKQTHAWGRPITPKEVQVRSFSRRFRFGPMKGRKFILFQKRDVTRITAYAAQFVFNPEKTKQVFGL